MQQVMAHELLVCPACRGVTRPGSEGLVCQQCGTELREIGGVYYAGVAPTEESAKETIEEFGRRWNAIYEQMGGLKDFLLPMIEPVQKEFFRDKIIVDAGGGFGRLTKILLDYGARHVVLLDASTAVLAASRYLEAYRDRVTIVRGDMLSPPLALGRFDLFFCHGVLHHTGAPRKGVLEMSKALKPDTGSMILWVYAAEGNRLMKKLINCLRFFARHAGDRGRWLMAGIVDMALWLLVFGVYKPLDALFGLKHFLWYGEYFLDFLFEATINNRMDRLQMYHDFLTTAIVEYYSKDQLLQWSREAGFKTVEPFFYRKQSWSIAASFNIGERFS